MTQEIGKKIENLKKILKYIIQKTIHFLDYIFSDLQIFLFYFFCLIIVLDFYDIDNLIYLSFCPLIRIQKYSLTCAVYYDLPIWEVLTSFGTVIAGFFAYKAIIQSNKQFMLNNKPNLVACDNLGVSGSPPEIFSIHFKNVSNGYATNIKITADSSRSVLIGDSSNPDIQDLGPNGKSYLAIDSSKLKAGLIFQNIHIKNNVLKEIDHINLYLWYEDLSGHKYKTTSSFVKENSKSHFLKIANNLIEEIR